MQVPFHTISLLVGEDEVWLVAAAHVGGWSVAFISHLYVVRSRTEVQLNVKPLFGVPILGDKRRVRNRLHMILTIQQTA